MQNLRLCQSLREIDIDHLEKLLNEKTKILSITHISNTLGTINPIGEITKLAHKFDTKVFIDGAQAIAHQKVNVTELDVTFTASQLLSYVGQAEGIYTVKKKF